MFKSITESITGYISEKNKATQDASFYKPKIDAFKNYLLYYLRFTDDYEGIQKLKTLSIDYIINSIDYFIAQSKNKSNKKYHVSKEGSLEDYLIVIKDYFKFLNNSNITNPNILLEMSKWGMNPDTINKIIATFNLTQKTEMAPYDIKEQEKLLESCDYLINNCYNKDLFRTKKYKDFTALTSAIALKLISFTGIKYSVLRAIKYKDIDLDKSIFRINKYSIDLPIEFSIQLKFYRDIRDKVSSPSDDDTFFITSRKTPLSKQTNDLVTFLTRYLGKSNITGISKHMIINKYMKNGVPEIIIKDLTRCEFSIIEDCKKYIDYKENYSDFNKLINKVLK